MLEEKNEMCIQPADQPEGDVANIAEKNSAPAGTIEIHPRIKSQLGCLPVMDMPEEEDFLEVFNVLLYEHDARSYSEQREVYNLALRDVEDQRHQFLPARIIGSEMKTAAEAVFRRRIDPANRVSPGIDAEARAMAEENRDRDTFCQDEIELEGFGQFPIDTEATKRAMPALLATEKLRAGNERARANGHKALMRIKAMKKIING